jgi:hypothetical protein
MMETVDAVECMVAIMFDGLLDESTASASRPPPEHPNGVRVRLLLKSGKAREHFAKNDDAWTCTVEIAGITGIA